MIIFDSLNWQHSFHCCLSWQKRAFALPWLIKIMPLSPVSPGACIMSPNLVTISLIMLKSVIIPPGIRKTVIYWKITLCDANWMAFVAQFHKRCWFYSLFFVSRLYFYSWGNKLISEFKFTPFSPCKSTSQKYRIHPALPLISSLFTQKALIPTTG